MNTDLYQKTILLVDDEPSTLETFSLFLSQEGYRVHTSKNADNIFETVEKARPNIILLDVLLDAQDGRDVCKALKRNEKTAGIPVIMISAHHDLLFPSITSYGANDVVAKPFTMSQLLPRIERQIQQASIHHRSRLVD